MELRKGPEWRGRYKPISLHSPQVRSKTLSAFISASQQVVGCAARRGQEHSFNLSLVDEYAENKFIGHLRGGL